MKKVKVSLRPLASRINLPTVIKTAILPGEKFERLFIATQVGEIYYIGNNGRLENFLDIKSKILQLDSNGGYDERGLLGLAFHPKFANNGLFYLHYSIINSQGEGALKGNFIPKPCDERTLNLKWEDRINKYDHIDTIEEWSIKPNGEKNKRRTILNIRRPFLNHNGVNSLCFSPETNRLLFVNGDGGAGYDPFNLAQDNNEIAGKIIEIDVDKNIFVENVPIVTRFSELPNPIIDIINVIAKGIRNSSGLTFQNSRKYIGNVGQELVESIFTYEEYSPVPARNIINNTPIANMINFGWRGWEGIFPTQIVNPCSKNSKQNDYRFAYYNEAVALASEHISPLACYFQYDARKSAFEGNALTGVQPYMGSLIPDLNGKIVFTDFYNSKIDTPIGILAYTNSEQHNQLNQISQIEIDYNFYSEPAFFVSLGSNTNHSRLYLGIHTSGKVKDFNQGSVYEIIPAKE